MVKEADILDSVFTGPVRICKVLILSAGRLEGKEHAGIKLLNRCHCDDSRKRKHRLPQERPVEDGNSSSDIEEPMKKEPDLDNDETQSLPSCQSDDLVVDLSTLATAQSDDSVEVTAAAGAEQTANLEAHPDNQSEKEGKTPDVRVNAGDGVKPADGVKTAVGVKTADDVPEKEIIFERKVINLTESEQEERSHSV
ncbi:uncharacterized protein [Cherax quadricarinatus]|uniref:uncharacterized protein n=1 Tax=Cherax quadricarinatus TaxID=27406 RepID=UPI00387EB667